MGSLGSKRIFSLSVPISAVLLVAIGSLAHAQKVSSPTRAESNPQISTELARLTEKTERTDATIAAQQATIASLSTKIDMLERKHTELLDEGKVFRSRVEEAGWKALDTTIKLSNLQWQLFGLVVALVGLGGFGGYQGYKTLRDKLEGDVKSSIKNHESILRANTGAFAFAQLGYGYWQQYCMLKSDVTPGATIERKRLLDAALMLSKFALKHADDLEKLDAENFERLITHARANHAYWLAEQPDPNDPAKANPGNAEVALSLGKKAFLVAWKYKATPGEKHIDYWPDWAESYCRVLVRFGSDNQKADAIQIIKELCDDRRIDAEWRKETLAEYSSETPPA